MEELDEDLNGQLTLISEYNDIKEDNDVYETFDDFLKEKQRELSLELETLRKKRIEKKGGDLLKRCAIVQKLKAIDECLQHKDIHNYFSEDQIIYADKSFGYEM